MDIGFLIELGWKSALIAGAALAAVTLMRRRAPADRAAVLKLAVALLLLLPVGAAVVPHLEIEAMPASASAAPIVTPAAPAIPAPRLTIVTASAPAIVSRTDEPSLWPSTEAMLGMAYLAGLLLIALRLGGGLMTLRRWTKAAEPADSPEWQSALARHLVPGRPAPRLLVSGEVPGPMSWGSLRPVILLDLDSFFRTQDADAILAHEMAHLARGDWRMLVLARTAVALFWFNPIVWLLEREVIQQAEEAADAEALGQVEATAYAQTLLTCARHHAGSRLPANSIAGSGLRRRVRKILDGRSGRVSPGSRWTLAAMIGCVAFAAPVAALELVEARIAPQPPKAPAALEAPAPTASPPAAPLAPVAAVLAQLPEAPPGPPAPPAAQVPEAPPVPAIPPMPRIDQGEIQRTIEAALAEADVEIERSIAIAAETAAIAVDASMRAMAAGGFGMEQGAIGMEQGARQMEAQAANFRSKAYRERIIADERRKGRIVTHAELIDAARELDEGADEMRRGAEEMRETAREMRDRAS